MHKPMYKRTAVVLMLVALLGPLSLGSALADEEGSLKEKVYQLEELVADLESLVKSLILQVQRVSENVVSDLEEFRPRLFAIERLAKENTFELRKLSGTVAQLAEEVGALSELPQQVAHLKASVAQLDAQLNEGLQALSHRIGSNELALSKLKESVERAMILTEEFKKNLGRLFARLEGVEERLSLLEQQGDALQGELGELRAWAESQLGSLAVRLEELESRLMGLKELMAQVEGLKGLFAKLQEHQAKLAARQEHNEAQLAQLKERLVVEDPRVAELERKVDKLTEKLAAVLIEVEQSRLAITELEGRLEGLREEIKAEVLAEIPPWPQVPTMEELRLVAEEVAAEQVKRAQAQAEAAQGLAIVALLAGLAAIAVSLLL